MSGIRRPPTRDPVADLSRRDRRSWRQTAERIQAQHDADTMARLSDLQQRLVSGIAADPPDAVTITVTEWTITIAGVTPTACANLRLLAARSCHLADSGRYGRFWWVAISQTTGDRAARAVLLGTQLRLARTEGGSRRDQMPDPCGVQQLVIKATRPSPAWDK